MCETLEDYKNSLPKEEGWYLVHITEGSCTCSDHVLNSTVCKHMFVVLQNAMDGENKKWCFDDLHVALRGMPHLMIDSTIIGAEPAHVVQVMSWTFC